jgi:hypothetical protein
MDKQGVELWLKRMVTESIKGSFNLWINASPRAMSSFELKEDYGAMKEKNAKLGILEDKKQTNNDLHEVLLNGITEMDKDLLRTEVKDARKGAVLELMMERQEIVKRRRMENEVVDNNVEPKIENITKFDKNQESDEDDFTLNQNGEEVEEVKKFTFKMLMENEMKQKPVLGGIPASQKE